MHRTLLLFAMTACTPSEGPAVLEDSATSHTTTTTTPTSPLLPANVSEALSCDVREPEDTTGTGSLHLITLQDAPARCNDGSPPVAHLRTATDPTHLNDWVITLEGGGECDSHADCVDRWCGESYDATKMSSRYAKTQIGGHGVHSDTIGDFRGWNHVRLYYCSSDMWTGTHTDAVLDGHPPYSLYFEGALILDAFLDALDIGALSDDATEQLPSLANAATVVFGGTSSGGWGAMQQLDSIAQRYGAANVVGISDAILYAEIDGFTPVITTALHGQLAEQFDVGLGEVWRARLDASCLTDLANTAEPWRCADQYTLHRDHVSTPYAANRDLADPSGSGYYLAAGATLAEYAAVSAAGQRRGARAAVGRGPACGHHSALYNDEWFHQGTVQDSLSGEVSRLHDSLLSVVQGAAISAIDAPTSQGSVCP